MILKEIPFRELLNNIVFIKNLDLMPDMENEFINGYFAYCFWSKEGEIAFRVVDFGFGDDEYFEINPIGIDFMENEILVPFEAERETFVRVFDKTVIMDNKEYQQIIESVEMKNLVDESLIETRENQDLDVFREISNHDIVKVSFEAKNIIFKSKAKVKCIAMEGGDFVGTLLEVPFGGFKLNKGDRVKFTIGRNNLNEKALVSRQ